jgi:hypothetical protein
VEEGIDGESADEDVYRLSVVTVQTIVGHDLYQNDQFCGLSGSLGPSEVTSFGSVLGFGRKGNGADFLLGSGSCGSVPEAGFHLRRCRAPFVLQDVDECAGEGAALRS